MYWGTSIKFEMCSGRAAEDETGICHENIFEVQSLMERVEFAASGPFFFNQSYPRNYAEAPQPIDQRG